MKNIYLIVLIGLILMVKIQDVNSFYHYSSDLLIEDAPEVIKMNSKNQMDDKKKLGIENRKQKEKQKFLKERFENQANSLSYRLLTLIG